MQFRSALELLLDNIGSSEARLGLSKFTPDSTRDNYISHIMSYQKSIKIITGEANSQLFNRPDLARALRESLSNGNNKTLQLVFHKNDDIKTAQEEFQVENEELVNLRREFPNCVHIYWSPIRPRQHYAVIDDGKKVILEEPNHKGFEPFWATIVLDEGRAKNWAERFDDYIKYCRELEFEPSGQPIA